MPERIMREALEDRRGARRETPRARRYQDRLGCPREHREGSEENDRGEYGEDERRTRDPRGKDEDQAEERSEEDRAADRR